MNMNDNFIFEGDEDFQALIDFGFPRKVHQRSNYFENMDNLTFFKRFNLYKQTVRNILEQIEDQLEYPDDRNNSVAPINQLLCCLRFYATAGHLSSIADLMGMDVATTSRIVAKVSDAIASLAPNYINMSQREQIISEQNEFFEIAQFSRVVGVVGGTHIKIQSPGDSGYALKPYFLTPLGNPQTRGELNYNKSHIKTRNTIERLIGVWKRRFPVVAYGIRLKLETVMAVIDATAVLHNIARKMNEEEPPVPENMAEELNNVIIQQQILPDYQEMYPNQINLNQNELIENYFSNIH